MEAMRYVEEPGRRGDAADIVDTRFRRLVGEAGWRKLPRAVQRRFCKRLSGAQSVVYRGVIDRVRCARAGRWLAQLCRVIGAPLPLDDDPGVPAIVAVSEDGATGGQCWTRIYGRVRGFPQVIHSAKRFAGETGLEEYLGCGVGMALRVLAVDNGLEFRSDHYFLDLGRVRVRLPRWLSPGETIVRHIDLGEGRFEFSLSLVHGRLGELVYQSGTFHDG